MRGRRKRAKIISHSMRTRSRIIDSHPANGRNWIGGREAKQDEPIINVKSCALDSGSFASRSSVRLIHDVVSKFDLQKRGLVESTGFHGILDFPPMKQFDRKFVLWLMSCVNVESCTLDVSEDISIRFSKGDVGCVFGIPSSGRRILDDSVPTREAKQLVFERYLGSEFKQSRSIKIVQEILEMEYEGPMSKEEADSFRVAFVVFVVSNLLSPSAKYDYASIDYWNAIKDPDHIISFDWSEYVIVRLLEAVSKLRQDVASNIKFPNIIGCSVFLQVWYLDSLDLGSVSMVHNVTPRIRCFSFEKMRLMIGADSNYAKFKDPHCDLSVVKLRDPSGCLYSWAVEKIPESVESPSGSLLAIWESAVAMVHLLNIPLEAAGPVFVAAADFQNQVNEGLVVTGSQALKFMTVLVSIMIPYRRGFSYQSSHTINHNDTGTNYVGDVITRGIELMSRPIRNKRKSCDSNSVEHPPFKNQDPSRPFTLQRVHDSEASSSNQVRSHLEHGAIGDHVQRSLKSVISSLDSLPHYMNVNLRVATAMSQFYSLLRKMKHPCGFDLNYFAPEESTSTYIVTHCAYGRTDQLPSPWELGFSWASNASDCRRILLMFHQIDDDDGLAIVHQTPKHIQVTFQSIREQLTAKCEMELDLFDALVRRLRQEDDELYASFGELRWRLFLESDFMEGIVSGSFDLIDPKLSEQLLLGSRTYDISRCKLIFFPALLQFSWLCFVWALDDNALYVFEPSYVQPLPEWRVEAIERACYLLKLAVQTLCGSVFTGRMNEVSFADMRLITIRDASISRLLRLNRSGVFCSLFCRCYDGADLNSMPTQIDSDSIASKLMIDIIKLKDNQGSINQVFNYREAT